MIISHRHKFIFIKTKKTAGTSLEIALSEFCGPEDVMTPLDPEDHLILRERGFPGPQNYRVPLRRYHARDWARLLIRRIPALPFINHQPATHIRKYVRRSVWQTYFKFCVERNPWDKALSAWHFTHHKKYPTVRDYIMSEKLRTLSDWHRYAEGDRVLVDHVIRYETLALEVAQIAERLGLPGVPQLPRAKGGFRKDRRPHWEVLGPEERDRIADVFAREIAHFGFRFQPEEPVPAS